MTTPKTAAAVPKWLYPAVLCGAILGYWLPRMFRGFWIDEAGAYWVARGGWNQVWHTIQVWPTQSILYAYLSTAFASNGPYKEMLLRLPSVAGMLLATWALYRLTGQMVGRESGWTAAIPFASAGAIVDMATNARPYALGLGVILISFWSLRQLVHTGERKWLAAYCVSAPLIVHFHYPFAVVFLVQAIYLWVAWRAGRRLPAAGLLVAASAVLAGAIPLIWPFLTLAGASSRWKTAALPTFWTFVSFFPLQAAFPVAIGLILFFVLHREWFGAVRTLAKDDVVLLLAWLLLGPVLFFILARVGSYAIFATRFLIFALPPFFILLAWCMRQVLDLRARFALVLAIVLSAALYVTKPSGMDEWRTPLEEAQRFAGPGTPILMRSGFVESAIFDWKSEPKPDTHLFAPLLAYPVQNEVLPVPFFVDAEAERYLEAQIRQHAARGRRFCLLANTGSDVLQSLPAWFESQGYTSSSEQVGGFVVMLFNGRPGEEALR